MDKQLVQEFIELIQTIGFPIVMVLWFALRLERKLEILTSEIEKLKEKL